MRLGCRPAMRVKIDIRRIDGKYLFCLGLHVVRNLPECLRRAEFE